MNLEANRALGFSDPSHYDSSAKYSLPERALSKNPKTRLNAMTDLVALINAGKLTPDNLAVHLNNFPKYLSDSNTSAAEKAVEAFALLTKKTSPPATETLSESLPLFIDKSFNSSKPAFKAKAAESLNALARSENGRRAIRSAVKSVLGGKGTSKVIAETLGVLTQLLGSFGNECFPIGEFEGVVMTLAESANAQVRNEVLRYLKEAYKSKQSLERNTEDIKHNEEFNSAHKFSAQWCSQMAAAKKWSDKRDRLEELSKAIAQEKVSSAGFPEVGKTLKGLLHDSNIVVANLTLRVIGEASKCLKQGINEFANQIFELVVHKVKDKKSAVEAQKCMDNLIFSVNLEDSTEIIKKLLGNKTAIVRMRMCTWLESAISNSVDASEVESIGLELVPTLLELVKDNSKEVEEAALRCIRAIGEHLDLELHFRDEIAELGKDKQEQIAKSTLKPQEKLVEENKRRLSEGKAANSSPARNIIYESFEEDVGPSISSESATKIVYENIPPIILAELDMNEATARQSGLKDLQSWVTSNKETAKEIVEAVVIWLKRKLKDFKDLDPELAKQLLFLLSAFCSVGAITKKVAREVIPFLSDNLEDVSLPCAGVISAVASLATPAYVVSLLVRSSAANRSPDAVKGVISVFIGMIEEYGGDLVPLRAVVEYVKPFLQSSDSSLKSTATHCVALAYNIAGNVVKSWVGMEAKGSGVPETDRSVQWANKVVQKLDDRTTRVRREGKNEAEKMLAEANRATPPAGLLPLITALKGRMEDTSKTLSRELIALVGSLALAMGHEFAQHSETIVPPLLNALDSMCSDARSETVAAMDKIAEAAGAESVLNWIEAGGESVEAKNSLLLWILAHKSGLAKCDEAAVLEFVADVFKNKSKELKTLAEQVVKELIIHKGHETIVNAVRRLKPSIKLLLQPILSQKPTTEIKRKRKNLEIEIPYNYTEEDDAEKELQFIKDTSKKYETAKPISMIDASSIIVSASENARRKLSLERDRNAPQQPRASFNTKEPSIARTNSSRNFKLPARKRSSQASSSRLKRHSRSASQGSRIADESLAVDTIVLSKIGTKEKRAEAEKKFKSITKRAGEERLRKTLKRILDPGLVDYMFSSQARKNHEALTLLAAGLKTELPALLDISDLLCKWIVMKMADQSNITFIKAALDFLLSLFENMAIVNSRLLDYEADIILPMLCEKLSLNNVFKNKIKKILVLASQLCSVIKLVNFLIKTLGSSKSRRAREESLGLLRELGEKHVVDEMYDVENVKLLVKLVGVLESPLSGQVAEVLALVHKLYGDSLWIEVGEIPSKAKAILAKEFNSSALSETTSSGRKKSTYPSTPKEKRKLSSNFRCITERSSKQGMEEPAEYQSRRNKERPVNRISEAKTVDLRTSAAPSETQDSEFESLQEALEVLKSEEISRRVNALMYLNEKSTSKIEGEKMTLKCNRNQLISAFTEVLSEIFNCQDKDVPIRFAKYFMTVVSKICMDKSIIAEASENIVSLFIEQLLTKMLYEGLEQMGPNKEGEYLEKAFNSTILRVLEYYDFTKSFVILIKLFKKYKDVTAVNYIKMDKLPSLIVKCILRLIKMIGSFVESLDVSKIFLALHDHLLFNPSSKNSDIAIRVAKTIVYELVNAKGEDIWSDYKPTELHQDFHIKRWINLILKSSHPTAFSPTAILSPENPQGNSPGSKRLVASGFNVGEPSLFTRPSSSERPTVLKAIFSDLNVEKTFKEAVSRLQEYLAMHPDADLEPHFATCRKGVRERVKPLLEISSKKAKDRATLSGHELTTLTQPKGVMSPQGKRGIRTSQLDYKSKLEMLRQKFEAGSRTPHKKS